MVAFFGDIKAFLTPQNKKEYVLRLFALLYFIPLCELALMLFFRPGPLIFQKFSRPLMFAVDYATTAVNYSAFLLTFLAWGALALQAKKFRCPWTLVIGVTFVFLAFQPEWITDLVNPQTIPSYLLTRLPYPVDLVLKLTEAIRGVVYMPIPFVDTYLRANFDGWIRIFFAVYFETLCILGYLKREPANQ